jgi:hypothetical protein
MTAAGGARLFILGAALIVLLLGPHHDRGPALIVIVIVLAMLIVNVMPTGHLRQLPLEPSLSERREQFHPDQRDAAGIGDPPGQAEAAQREPEAYPERDRQAD